MKKLKFKKIDWWKTSFQNREKKFLLKAFKEKNFTAGKNNLILENKLKNIFGSKHCITCNSGTSALIMSLISLDIKPGDEIIVPNFTWIATANAAAILGAKLKLVDLSNITMTQNILWHFLAVISQLLFKFETRKKYGSQVFKMSTFYLAVD